MVCPRCVSAVEEILTRLGIPFREVKLGKAIVKTDTLDYRKLDEELKAIGFEIIQNKNAQLVEQIKTAIIAYIHDNKGGNLKMNISTFLKQRIGFDYTFISSTFSKSEQTTIEKWVIVKKIDRVKELIAYNELNFSEIAFKLNYSSASHLSKQFKRVTGFTLSNYKRNHIEEKD